jgi:exonuclease SbcC
MNKCKFINKIKLINEEILNINFEYNNKDELNKWFLDYNEMNDKYELYENTIIEYDLYNKYLIEYKIIKKEIDIIIEKIEKYNNEKKILKCDKLNILKNIENIRIEINNKNLINWLEKYSLLKNNYNIYIENIKENELYNEYNIKLNEIKNNINDVMLNIKNVKNNILILTTEKNKNLININNINYTIYKAYQFLDKHNNKLYNEWLLKIDIFKNNIKLKPIINKYIDMKEIYESNLLYNEYDDIISSYKLYLIKKNIIIWNNYYLLSKNLNISKIHIKRKECLNNISIIENDINEQIIYKTKMLKIIEINNNTKLLCSNLLNIKINIKEISEYLKIILDNYNLFQNWLYNTHILPNIIKMVNTIIDNDGIQFILNNNGITSINKASGFQKFLINIALRLTFTQLHTNVCKCEQLFLDEGWTSADQFNRNLIPKILQFLLTKYSTVILVSHIDEIKENVDIKINITKDSYGFSKI